MFGGGTFGANIFGQATIVLDPLTAGGGTGILLQALVIPKQVTSEGELIESVGHAWIEIINFLNQSPENIHQLGWRKLEELIAAAYDRLGFEEVTLTPHSGDKGRDVIAVSMRLGEVKFLDQAKAYKPDRPVTANDVRAMVGVLTTNPNASKGLVTTTSSFAPGIMKDPSLTALMPSRLELRDRAALLAWLNSIPRKP